MDINKECELVEEIYNKLVIETLLDYEAIFSILNMIERRIKFIQGLEEEKNKHELFRTLIIKNIKDKANI